MKLFAIILGIILFIILVILLIRIRIRVIYSENGLETILKIWFFKMHLPPRKEKKAEKQAAEEAEKKEPKLPGGNLLKLTDLLKIAVKIAGRALKTIRIDELYADIKIASSNAFKTAMMFGGAASGVGILIPILENNFNIRQKKIEINADFEKEESTVFLRARLSIAVWQIAWLGILFVYHSAKMQKLLQEDKRERKMKKHGRSCTGRNDVDHNGQD